MASGTKRVCRIRVVMVCSCLRRGEDLQPRVRNIAFRGMIGRHQEFRTDTYNYYVTGVPGVNEHSKSKPFADYCISTTQTQRALECSISQIIEFSSLGTYPSAQLSVACKLWPMSWSTLLCSQAPFRAPVAYLWRRDCREHSRCIPEVAEPSWQRQLTLSTVSGGVAYSLVLQLDDAAAPRWWKTR